MAFQSAVEAATVVINKQKTCASRVDSSVQRLISLVEAAKARVEAADPKESPESVLAELDKQIQEEMKKATTQTKELHSAVGKLGKVCDACFLHAWVPVLINRKTINESDRGPRPSPSPHAPMRTDRPDLPDLRAMQAIEKTVDLDFDICKVMRNVPMNDLALNQVRGVGRPACSVHIFPPGESHCRLWLTLTLIFPVTTTRPGDCRTSLPRGAV